MIYHPTIIILASVIALIIYYKQERTFSFIALSMPIIVAIFFYNLPVSSTISLFNLTIIYEVSSYNKLIGTAFILVLFSANLYALGQKKKPELILGSAYGAFAFFCLLAGDFLSMFVGLELMMVLSCVIIFIGGMRASLRSAKKYFLTHLMSSNMIIIGITHLITKNNSLALVPITELLDNPEYSTVILAIMLTGMLINIAAFPFSGWMVNYYPKASPSGFLYLISFTTKVSMMLLIKLFAGYEPLKYVAIIMVLYASIKSIFEDNLLSLLCYLSIMAMGLMLLGVSYGSKPVILATVSYLFIHIIYKLLLSISIASIIDQAGITNCLQLKKIDCRVITAGLVIGVAMMINVPATSTFYIKSSISHVFAGDPIYLVTLFLSFMTILALPWKRYFSSKEHINIKLNIYSKYSILSVSITLLIVGIAGRILPVISQVKTFKEISIFSVDLQKQVAIMLITVGLAMLYNTRRKNTRPINFIEWIGKILFYCDAQWLKQTDKEHIKEPLAIESLERQVSSKLSSIHTQQTAIFVVFTIFIVMLIVLTTSV